MNVVVINFYILECMYPQPFNYSGPDESLDMVGVSFLFAVEHSYILNKRKILFPNLKLVMSFGLVL